MDIDFESINLLEARAFDNKGALMSSNLLMTVRTNANYGLNLLNLGGVRTNGFKLCLRGESGRNYDVLASADLKTTNWLFIGTMEPTNGIWSFLDTNAVNFNSVTIARDKPPAGRRREVVRLHAYFSRI